MNPVGQQDVPHNLSPTQVDLDLQYLYACLSRLDVIIHRAVYHWQQAGQNPADPFRGLSISDLEAQALLARPVAGNWGQLATLDSAELGAFDQAERSAVAAIQNI